MKRSHPDMKGRRTRNVRRWLVCLASGCLVAAGALALPEDREQPMTIQADEGTVRSNSGQAHFEGNVYLKQGTLEVWADTLDVTRDPQTGDIQFLEAHGEPARYQELPETDGDLIRVRGLRIEYRPEEDMIITEGEGYLEQAGSEIQADYIQYNLNDESLRVRSQRASGDDPEAPQASWTLQPEVVD